MRSDKKYFSISEVSKILDIKEHIIRHWDSIDPKTNKLRIENLSIRTNGGTRFFNKFHIKNISSLQKVLKENSKRNYSLNLASKTISKKIIQQKRTPDLENKNIKDDSSKIIINFDKIRQIKINLMNLLNAK